MPYRTIEVTSLNPSAIAVCTSQKYLRKAKSYRRRVLGALHPLPVKPLGQSRANPPPFSFALLTASRETPRMYSMNSPSSSSLGFPLTTGSTTKYEWKICVEYFPALETVSSFFIRVCQEPLWRWASSSSSQAAAYRVPKPSYDSEENKSRPDDFRDVWTACYRTCATVR